MIRVSEVFEKQLKGSQPFWKNLKNLINPNTISFAIGIIMLITGIKIPAFINQPIAGLGKTTIYLAMLYIGAVLIQNSMITAFKRIEIYTLIFNKMLFIPFILMLIINVITFIFNIHIGIVAKTVVVMQTAMPGMALVVVLAKKFGSDDVFAAENLFLTTIFSLATLPLIYYVVQIL